MAVGRRQSEQKRHGAWWVLWANRVSSPVVVVRGVGAVNNQCAWTRTARRAAWFVWESGRERGVWALRVLYVTSEVFPLAKAGGLADVSAALPVSLREQGIDIQLLMPGYQRAMDLAGNLRLAKVIENPLGFGQVRIWKGTVPDTLVPVWLVECQSLYARDGTPYQDEHGRDFVDNPLRFGLLCYIGAMIATHAIGMSWCPDLVHVNDWQTALLPNMLRLRPRPHPPTVLSVHNLAYQGLFPAVALRHLPVPAGGRTPAGGGSQISFLQTGLRSADRIVTVSPTYAAEIRTPEYGCGLDEILRNLRMPIRGILNGADYKTWDPARDPCLVAGYGPADLSNKQACKSAIQQELGLDEEANAPLVAFLSRLAWQKMPEVVLEILPALLAEGIQFGLVAEGDRRHEASFRSLAAAYPGRVGVRIGYDEAVAHRLVAGADMMLSPARYEPCGLTAVYAMRYGTPPIARRTGGLIDTVADVQPHGLGDGSGTGFLFNQPTAEEAMSGVRRALQLFRQKTAWRRVQVAGMLRDFSWTRSAREYAELYRQMIGDCGRPAAAAETRNGWSQDHGRAVPHAAPVAAKRDDSDRSELIRQRAYEIWEEQGRPHGHDVDHWLQAEAELGAPRPATVTRASGKVSAKAVVLPGYELPRALPRRDRQPAISPEASGPFSRPATRGSRRRASERRPGNP